MSFLKNKRFIAFIALVAVIAISGFRFLNDKFIIGFQHPESVFVSGKYMYVSNIGAQAASQNLDGFITKLDKYGNILEYKFIDKLKAPKGIYVYKNRLYIADLDRVCIVELNTNKKSFIDIKGAKFLNDIIVLDDTIYVSDTYEDTVYKIDKNGVGVFFHKDKLSPNGIAFSKTLNDFLILSFNKPVVNIVSFDGQLIKSVMFDKFKGFDGISIVGNNVFISDYFLGDIIKTDLNLQKTDIIKSFKTAVADIFINRKKIIAPLLEDNKLYIGDIDSK
jgi:hypothetical protein